MRAPHFRVRTMMIAIVVLALLLWGGMLATRSITYSFWASGVAQKRDAYRADIQALERRAGKGLTARDAELLAYGRRMVQYLDRQHARYERAVHHPWLPVEPDPPVPR
jgi:hypothetical protein